MSPRPTSFPKPLPADLLPSLAADHSIALFLDYDGTISEITPAFAQAQPVAGAREAIAELVAYRSLCTVAVISGRPIDRLIELLDLSHDLLFVGCHGLEVMEQNGQRWLAEGVDEARPALQQVRQWLAGNVPAQAGFIVEDKELSIALHYRLADPGAAQVLREQFCGFVGGLAALRVADGKMVIEALPAKAGKGYAVRFLTQSAADHPMPVYFGDDLTDEEAFFALRQDGITVRVGAAAQTSWARFHVDDPTAVINALRALAQALKRRANR